ncbi:MAG: protein-disulfide reductase DsbD N-terminal domain-containing protein [Candidatus Solibacter usitatus]|nr:protein-disulfide reductase DsbD N-terminal domain-containing protein [Candidatus Solibacter usitatus]
MPVLTLLLALLWQTPPVQWSITAPAAKTQVQPGGKFTVTLAAEIAEGWHLYSLKKQEGGPIPTSITVPEGQPFGRAGEIDAPPPLSRFEETFQLDIESYEGSAGFGVPVEVSRNAKAGPATLAVHARYQACDNRICLPPKTVKLELPVEIRP